MDRGSSALAIPPSPPTVSRARWRSRGATQEKSTIIAQASSIGSLGANYYSWITTDIVNSMSKAQNNVQTNEFEFIFPANEDFKRSYDMRDARCAFTYSIQNHSKQSGIERYMGDFANY